MKTLIRDAKKPLRSFVPIASFEFESFEIRVRRVKRERPLPIGVRLRKVSVHPVLRQFKPVAGPIDAFHITKILLPSPSLQGRGLMSLPLRAQPVDPAALSSRQFPPTAPDSFSTQVREPEEIAPLFHKMK